MDEAIRIVVADDHELFRRGLVEILREEQGFELVGEASDGLDAVRLCNDRQPEIVLMDIHMPGGDGIEAVRKLKTAYGPRILMLTVSDEDDDLIRALAAGADGYLLKNTRPEKLCLAIRQVFAGHGALSPEVTATVMRTAGRAAGAGPRPQLSRREQEVLTLVAQGATTAQIAAALGLSQNTVKTYAGRVLKKLEAVNRTEAVARAAAMGLLESHS